MMEITIRRTWKPTAAGILNIITGSISALGAIGLVIALFAIGNINITRYLPPADAPFIAPLVSTILVVLLIISIIEAVFPIIGGIYALQRRKWGWALAGSVIAILGTFLLGVLATIFVAMAKEEFE
jgi:hypothetical protein